MSKSTSTYILYKCNEIEFNKRVDTLRKMIEIYNNDNYLEEDKAYQMLKLCNKTSDFEKKYGLLSLNGTYDFRLQDVYSYISIISIKLNEYKELGYEAKFILLRALGKEIEDYEKSKSVVNAYIKSIFYTEDNILNDIGVTSFEFEEHIVLIRKVCPELYAQYLYKKAKSPYKLYKCGEKEFNKRIDLLKNMIEIYNNDNLTEVDKVYQMFKIFNKGSDFEHQYRLLLKNGSKDSRLKDIYEYIPKINVMLSKYRESEKDFAEIRKLERKMEDFYEQARMVIFAYIESKQFIEEQILEDIGVTSLDFEKHVKLVEVVAPRLYNQYLEKKAKNLILKYDDCINSFMDIANGIETGYFSDGTKFSLLEFWARVPFRENYKNYDLEFKFLNSNLERFGFDFINRVTPFVKAVLPQKQQDIILNFMLENNIKAVSNTMTNVDAKNRYGSLKRVVRRYINENNEEVLLDFDFTEEDFQNIVDYMKLRRMPLIYEIFDCVLEEYIMGNITKGTIEEMKNNRLKRRRI